MATPFDLRARLPSPKHPDGGLLSSKGVTSDFQRTPVTLRHPGYPDQHNILLVFPALDLHKQDSDNDGRIDFGLHHETARVACAIVANCRWDGFLSEDKASGARPVMIGPDDLLLGRSYYFHIPNSDSDSDSDTTPDGPYPIVPSFAHFQFPHQNLPPTWKASSLTLPASQSNAVLARDVSCRVTASKLGTEIAHLIPRSEDTWFTTNQMSQYSSRPDAFIANSTDDVRNAMLLSSNIHSTFDQRRFVLVPKRGSWAIHVLSGLPGDELAAVYHNVQPQQLSGLAIEYLFARFAWTVLAQGAFLRTGVRRRLIIVPREDGVPRVSDVSGQECRTMFAPNSLSGSKSRSQSPKKRVRDDTAGGDVVEDYDDLMYGDDSVWDTRGRSRKRQFYASNSISSSAASTLEHWRDVSTDCEGQVW
ncbi:hypothetical protein G3M48_004206 [Beauveria asiatica]|uniref:HNH nuclease domain-containing protein n=1 Tax=Beauveria asiatica TaxID=1069075 RepID=A0AAW0RTU1_9HYPO